MTKNILELTSKVSTSPQNSGPSLSPEKEQRHAQTRVRKPLPIIDAKTGKEIQMEKDAHQILSSTSNSSSQYSPPKSSPTPPVSPQQSSSSANNTSRNPLPIINPKTGQVVSNQGTQKKAIPIIDPVTGTELENSYTLLTESRKNIIKQPFTVIINRPTPPPPQPKRPQAHYIPPQNTNGYQSHPLTILRKQDHSQLYNPYQSSPSAPPVWNKSKPNMEWLDHSNVQQHHRDYHHNNQYRHNQLHHQHHTKMQPAFLPDMDDEEEESEVDKYEWTGLPCYGFGMSFLDDDECAKDSRLGGLKERHVAVW